MKIKCWINRIARYAGGLHIGIRYHFPHTVIEILDKPLYTNYQFDIGLLFWEFHIAILIVKHDNKLNK